MKTDQRGLQRLQRLLLLLLVLTFCLYLPTLFHATFADDSTYLAYTNRFLREAAWPDIHQLLFKPANPWEFLPLRDFTYWLDFRIWDDEAFGLHASNLIWYATSAVAVFALFRQLARFCRPTAPSGVLALCGALLFSVHPAHVEVAAWIASRKDLVAATLSFLTLAVLARALRRGWPWPEILLAALLVFAACFGKASAMTTVLVVSALIGGGWRASAETAWTRKSACLLLFWILFFIAFAIHFKVGQSTGIRIDNSPGAWAVIDRASRVLATLIGIVVFPYPLRFYYDVYLLGSWHWLVSAGAIVLLLVALRDLLQRHSLWAFGVVLLLAPLFVYLQLAPFTTWSLASERFVFAAVAGWALLLADLLGRIDRPATRIGLLFAIVLPSLALVSARIADWSDSRALLQREYAMQPHFHNAIRDRIVFDLLPEQAFSEAAALARQIPRKYAADALLALVDAEQAYRRLNDVSPALAAVDDTALLAGYCHAVVRLRLATQSAYAHIRHEPDVSYNNLLRTLEIRTKRRYDEPGHRCLGKDE